MSQDQFKGLLNQLLPIVGGILAALGFVSPEQWGTWTTLIMQISGPLFMAAGFIWTLIRNTKGSVVQSIAAMPETKVSPDGRTIEIRSTALAAKAAEAATPPAR